MADCIDNYAYFKPKLAILQQLNRNVYSMEMYVSFLYFHACITVDSVDLLFGSNKCRLKDFLFYLSVGPSWQERESI